MTRGAIPGLVVAGTRSHSGKTSVTLALLCALKARGFLAGAGKVGPDYIDPGFHAAVTGRVAENLDLWMCGSPPAGDGVPGLMRIVSRLSRGADLLVLEGAMGMFDGAWGGIGSTAHVASSIGLPILLLLDASGCSQSVAAMAEGFVRHRPGWMAAAPRVVGLVCTHVGSGRHSAMLADALAPLAEEIPLLGMLPRTGAPKLPSRHLGLVEASHVFRGLDEEALARWIERNLGLDRLLALLGLPASPDRPAGNRDAGCPDGADARKAGITIGIARDEAFSFCYGDLPALLRECGADVVFFSPLHDAAIPGQCHGIYLPGGYPEEYAQALAENTAMLTAFRKAAAAGVPIYGECGGYAYLVEGLRYRGRRHSMAGLLPGTCVVGDERAALGYRSAMLRWRWLLPEGGAVQVRGHEFHYGRMDGGGVPEACAPLWEMWASNGDALGAEGRCIGAVGGSWLHLYPEGARPFWTAWVSAVGRVREQTAGGDR
jgi:cobyrinic acid a,c-diamide synthase